MVVTKKDGRQWSREVAQGRGRPQSPRQDAIHSLQGARLFSHRALVLADPPPETSAADPVCCFCGRTEAEAAIEAARNPTFLCCEPMQEARALAEQHQRRLDRGPERYRPPAKPRAFWLSDPEDDFVDVTREESDS